MPTTATATNNTHFGAIIGFRQGQEGVEFLVIDYDDPEKGLQCKLPGGMGAPGETPARTAQREYLEETGLENISGYGPVWKIQLKDGHRKLFFASHCDPKQWIGELRKEAKSDGAETLSPPYWLSSKRALTELHHYHRMALKGSLPVMADHDPIFREMALKDPTLAPLLR
jgi:8-oxo-dGTP pyrophosphatase MutT (NUDIX family)